MLPRLKCYSAEHCIFHGSSLTNISNLVRQTELEQLRKMQISVATVHRTLQSHLYTESLISNGSSGVGDGDFRTRPDLRLLN